MDELDPRHGTRRGYYAHRKADQHACEPCKRAAAAAEARYVWLRAQGTRSRLDPTGVRRRLQALVAIGYTWERIDDELGEISRQSEKWARGNTAYVFPSTFKKVAEVYERLCMTFPPENTPAQKAAATRSRNRAKRLGWVPPLAWDDIDNDERPTIGRDDRHADPVVVERVLAGDWTLARAANKAERAEVVRQWRALGRSTNELDRLTGWRAHRYIESDQEAVA